MRLDSEEKLPIFQKAKQLTSFLMLALIQVSYKHLINLTKSTKKKILKLQFKQTFKSKLKMKVSFLNGQQ